MHLCSFIIPRWIVKDTQKQLKEMKYFKQTYIVSVFLLFGCSQTDRNNTSITESKPIDIIDKQTLKQDDSDSIEQQDSNKKGSIDKTIALFKTGNIDKISEIISFPLQRQYPIPSIKDKVELKQRFSEVFDKILIDKIANSKIEQWKEVGWRGIMLDDGIFWIDSDGEKITAVNYQSDFEKKLREDLIAKEKEILHLSLKNFENPVYKIKTKNYLIRIDELANHKYRYASWKISNEESSKPSIILSNGVLEYQGSGGNLDITFTSGDVVYKINRNIIGEENMPDITLEVEKDGQIILTEDGVLTSEY